MITKSRDIKVGKFYRSGDTCWYYVGIKYGRTNRLCVVNLSQSEVDDNNTPLFPNDKKMYMDWDFKECKQSEVLKNY